MKSRLTVLVGALLFLPLVASHFGVLHPLGDSLAVFRLWLAAPPAAGIAAQVLSGRYRVGLVLVVLLAALEFSAVVQHLPVAPRPADYALYQKNLFFRSDSQADLLADIRTARPDFLTFQEVAPGNLHLLDDLGGDYPSRHFCPFAAVGGVAVMSRWPIVAGRMRCGDGFAAMQLETPDGALWLVSLHLHWPFPRQQAMQLDAILPELARLGGPVVLGGDFNMAPWSHAFSRILAATGTKKAPPVHYTLKLVRRKLALLPIDHVLTPRAARDVSVERRPTFRSDHHGLLARFSLQPRPIRTGSNG